MTQGLDGSVTRTAEVQSRCRCKLQTLLRHTI
jgi:hypothetical protein